MLKNIYRLSFIILFYCLGCNGEKFSLDFSNPSVKSSSPGNNATGVDNNASIRIQFDKRMDQRSVEDNLSFVDKSTTQIEHLKSWDGRTILVITPSRPMRTGMQYRIQIGENARDSVGNKLNIPFILIFTVNLDNILPEVLSINVQGLNSAGDFNFINQTFMDSVNWKPAVTIQFSKSMDKEKTSAAVSYNNNTVTYGWTNDDKTLTVNPTAPLSYGQKYSVVVGTNATDRAGNYLKQDKNVYFFIGNDFNFPTITSCLVQSSGVDISLTNATIVYNIDEKTPIRITFSRPMDVNQTRLSVKLEPFVSILSPLFNATQTVMTIIPAENARYDYGKQYSITVTKEAKDTQGNTLYQDNKRSFVIGSDFIPVELNSLSINDKIGVEKNLLILSQPPLNIPFIPVIKLKFNRWVSTRTLPGAISFSPTINSTAIIYDWKSNSEVWITFNEKLAYGQLYSMTVNNSIKNDTEKVSLKQSYTVYFYVGDPGDYLEYKVTTTNDGLWPMNIKVNSSITLTFNKSIDPDTIFNNIKINSFDLKQEYYSIADKQVVLDLRNNMLAPETTYSLTIKKGLMALDNSFFPTPPSLKEEKTIIFNTEEALKINKVELSVVDNDASYVTYYDRSDQGYKNPLTKLTIATFPNNIVYIRITFNKAINKSSFYNTSNLQVKAGSGPTTDPDLYSEPQFDIGDARVKIIASDMQKPSSGTSYYTVKISGVKSCVNKNYCENIPMINPDSVFLNFMVE